MFASWERSRATRRSASRPAYRVTAGRSSRPKLTQRPLLLLESSLASPSSATRSTCGCSLLERLSSPCGKRARRLTWCTLTLTRCVTNEAPAIVFLVVDFALIRCWVCGLQKQYLAYYDAIMGNETHDGILAPNGIILADNVLWKGVVLNYVPELKSEAPPPSSFPNPKRMEKMATVMHEFNARVSSDPRVRCTMLPLRDGLMIIQKK